MGPHPAVARIRAKVREALADCSPTVIVACSGGADSLALAAAVAFEAPRAQRAAGLVTIDHGLQPDSAAQAARVADIGYELGLDPVEIIPVEVAFSGGPEAAAREARYAALARVWQAWDADVLLGHTLDDQAETVLLGLGRGSGPRSIVGMRPRTGRLVRPLLGVRRSETAAACGALGLEPWDDPHNADPAFQRVRLRRDVLPLLEEVLQGGVAQALARTGELLRDDLDALEDIAHEFAATRGLTDGPRLECEVDASALAELPRAVRSRVLRSWVLAGGASEVSAERLGAVDALITDWHGQGPVELPGHVRVSRVSGRLVLDPRQ